MASTKIIPNIYRERSYYHAATHYTHTHTHTRNGASCIYSCFFSAFYFHFVNCGQIYHIYGVHLIICEFSKIMGFCQFVPSFRQQKSSQLSSQSSNLSRSAPLSSQPPEAQRCRFGHDRCLSRLSARASNLMGSKPIFYKVK